MTCQKTELHTEINFRIPTVSDVILARRALQIAQVYAILLEHNE